MGDKWQERTHELLMGHYKDHVNPSIMMWFKRQKGEQPITAIGASFNEDEEQFYIADGYTTCGEDLKKYSLGQGVLLWFKRAPRGEKPKGTHPTLLEHELDELKELLKATPDDAELLHTIDKTERELRAIRDENESREKLGLNKGPLESACEFLALGAEEVADFRKVFHKLDKDHDGQVNQQEFCQVLSHSSPSPSLTFPHLHSHLSFLTSLPFPIPSVHWRQEHSVHRTALCPYGRGHGRRAGLRRVAAGGRDVLHVRTRGDAALRLRGVR
jgi:hypothetical protein